MPSCHTANHVLLRCGFNKNTQFLSFSAKIKKEKKNLNKANFSSVKAFPFLFHLMMLNGEHGLLSCWCVSVALLQVASSFLGRPEIILKKEKSKKMFCCQNNCSSKPLPGCHVQKGLHKTLNNLHAYKKHVISILGALLKMWLKDFYTTFFFFFSPPSLQNLPPSAFYCSLPPFFYTLPIDSIKKHVPLKKPSWEILLLPAGNTDLWVNCTVHPYFKIKTAFMKISKFLKGFWKNCFPNPIDCFEKRKKKKETGMFFGPSL